ncbi:Ig-like domain-containing protein [Antricoccus suffuscus]|uniref:Ig-like domain-containing protein n=1 Tax=Antricoccus suffuscus TaxID=1629062 RepID=A0A2T1A4J3_9ACTN|nr:right-handed parallel beta-helix repeat-containing protein [Antricoccus suffuscus]PRZ43515.1 Ig-like domain-containing protein [Antricoccus suffuscus]
MASKIASSCAHRARRAAAFAATAALAVGSIAAFGAPAAVAAPGEYYASPAGSGDCTDVSSPCSLDTALAMTDASAIYLVADGGTAATFATSTGWNIDTDLTIQPADGVTATFDGQHSATHIFSVAADTSLTISGVTIENTSVTDTSGGGIYSLNGTVVVADSTFANNTATDSGSNVALGGGISSVGPRANLTVRSSTFVGNIRTSDSGFSGGIVMGNGNATVVSSTFVGNTLGISGVNSPPLTGNLFAANEYSCTGFLTDSGYNVADDDTCGFTPGGTSQTVSLESLKLPDLSSNYGLADNGGLTQTVLPGAGSSASGVIPAGTAMSGVIINGQGVYLCGDPTHPVVDQRGVPRPIVTDQACTAGAVEIEPAPVSTPTTITVTPTNNPSTFGGTTFTVEVTTTTDNQPVPTGEVTLDALGNGCVPPYTPLPQNGDGTVTKTYLLGAGDHQIVACYRDSGGAYAPSESVQFTQHVNRAPTSTTLMSSANPSNTGASVTYTVGVEGYVAGDMWNATVDFVDVTDAQNPVVVCSGVTFDRPDDPGLEPKATCTDQPTAGGHTVEATYNGTTNYAPSSATLTQTVDSPVPPAPVITAPADGSTTDDTTPAITGTGVVGNTVTVAVDGHAIGTTQIVAAAQKNPGVGLTAALTAGDAGTWSLTAPQLSDGTHTVVAFQTDPAGNDSADATTTFLVLSASGQPTAPSDSSAPSGTSSSASAVPPTGETTPTDGGSGSDAVLASTGTTGLSGLLAIALGAILAGVALQWRLRRRPGRHA